jgi:hypothetical protein
MAFYKNTSADSLMKTLDKPLEKKSKAIYGPTKDKRALFFIDDLSMCIPRKESDEN